MIITRTRVFHPSTTMILLRLSGIELSMRAEMGEIDFGAALEIAQAKKVLWAAALKIQMARRARKARQELAARRQRQRAAEAQ